MNPVDRKIVEALKRSPYVKITFEFGYDKTVLEMKDKMLSHDIGMAVQSYINRKTTNQ